MTGRGIPRSGFKQNKKKKTTQATRGGLELTAEMGSAEVPAELRALFTDSSVYTNKGLSGRRARPLCNDVMMSSIWIEEWSVCVYITRLRIHSPASQPRRSADERRSGNQATSPTPPPLRIHYRRVHSGTKQSSKWPETLTL